MQLSHGPRDLERKTVLFRRQGGYVFQSGRCERRERLLTSEPKHAGLWWRASDEVEAHGSNRCAIELPSIIATARRGTLIPLACFYITCVTSRVSPAAPRRLTQNSAQFPRCPRHFRRRGGFTTAASAVCCGPGRCRACRRAGAGRVAVLIGYERLRQIWVSWLGGSRACGGAFVR